MNSNMLVSKGVAGPEFPRWSETLRDRTHVLIRPITPEDHDEERAFIEGLSEDARRYRFLGQVRWPSEQLIEQFTRIDYVHDVAFVAVVREDGRSASSG